MWKELKFNMNKSKKYIFLLIIILFFCGCTIDVKAIPGCCSWHGGEVGCSRNKTLCADGTVSSCPCDGTSSITNRNYTNNNNKNEPVSLWMYIVGLIIIFIGVYVFLYFIQICEIINKNRKNNQRIKREIEYREEQEKLKKQKDDDVECIISNENLNSNYIDELDEQSICRFTSDDLLKIINANNDNIFNIFNKINNKKNNYTERNIFDVLCRKILENKKLSSLQNKCVKYLIKEKLINDYENIFLIALLNQHTLLAKYIMSNCNDIEFNFTKTQFINGKYQSCTQFIFESLLKINDLSFAEKISKKANFKFDIGTYLFEQTYQHNNRIKYQLLSIFCNNCERSYVDIERLFEIEFKLCRDDNEIIRLIDKYLQIDYLLEEKGYFLIYLLTKKQKVDCIQYILDNCKNINLNKYIVNSLDKKYDGLTPLIYACYRKSNKIVEILLNYGADGNFPDIDGNYPIEYVCNLKNFKLIKLLYEKGYRLKNDKENKDIEYCLKHKDFYLLPYKYICKLYNLNKK